jgi:HlyD family secretion protein
MKLAPVPGIALFAVCAVLALAGCKKPPEKETEAARARAFQVVRVENRGIVGGLSASGDLIPREEAAVMPEVTGYRALRVTADLGDHVRAGQTLVVLDPSLLEAQVAQAQAQADQAEDQARRVADLDGQGVISQEQIAQRRFQAQAARATLRNLQTQRRKLAVVAPVSGVVLERTVRPGDLSAGGATPWFRLARDGQIELAAELTDQDLARIRVGQTATVTLPSGAVATGRVRLISPQIDPQTKLGQVRILLPVRPDIRAGGFARAVFADAAGVVLAVPETAIRYDADGAGVMTVAANDRVKRMSVQTGARGGGYVQLTKGPAAGTRVVQNAAAFLLDNDLIKPLEGRAVAAAPAAKTAAPTAKRP